MHHHVTSATEVIANCVPKLVAMATSLCTSGYTSNTIPWAHLRPQPKRHLDQFSRFCTDDRRASLYFTMGRPFSPSKLPLPMEDLDPHLIHGSLPPSPQPKRHLDRFSHFCRSH